jgi:hypothetical protein
MIPSNKADGRLILGGPFLLCLQYAALAYQVRITFSTHGLNPALTLTGVDTSRVGPSQRFSEKGTGAKQKSPLVLPKGLKKRNNHRTSSWVLYCAACQWGQLFTTFGTVFSKWSSGTSSFFAYYLVMVLGNVRP